MVHTIYQKGKLFPNSGTPQLPSSGDLSMFQSNRFLDQFLFAITGRGGILLRSKTFSSIFLSWKGSLSSISFLPISVDGILDRNSFSSRCWSFQPILDLWKDDTMLLERNIQCVTFSLVSFTSSNIKFPLQLFVGANILVLCHSVSWFVIWGITTVSLLCEAEFSDHGCRLYVWVPNRSSAPRKVRRELCFSKFFLRHMASL